ncbi:MAG: hypothetical protein KF729_19660 [Sandaracinaceae bacterium]|nr:hypothetical protein [Sandaracinaceae bacterium]
MARDGIECDESRWPIVVFRTIGIPADADVDAFIAKAEECLARGEPYVVVFDNSEAARATPYMRRRASEWLEANSRRLGHTCLGTALVFRSAAFRFVLSTVMLVVSHPVPHEVCASLEQALRWSEAQLRRRASARAEM